MCLLCSACSVYFHISCKERVHCSHGGKRGEGGGLHCCHVCRSATNSKFCWSNGELSVWKPFAYSMTWYTWSRSICFLVSSPDPTQEERIWWCLPNSSGFITIGGKFPICQSHCRKHHLWFQHWKILATSARWQKFWGTEKKLAACISSQLQAMNFYEARGS